VARRINLLPRTERVRTTTNFPALILLVIGLIAVFGLGFGYYLLRTERGNLEEELEAKQTELRELQAQVAALDEYKILAADVADMETVVTGVYAGRTLVSKVLSDFSLVIPENVWITSFSLTAGEPQVESAEAPGTFVSGVGRITMSGNTYSFPDVASFLVRHKLESALEGITLSNAGAAIGAVDPSKKIRGFSLSAAVRNTQPADTPLPLSKVQVEGL
jgi:Tfp pilus assembly protein PilN